MLKEIFLIDRSVLQFHYSSDRLTSDDDKAVLSSGFFSAIQDFSSHARSDAIDSFSTENEYFLYVSFPEENRVLVGVFDRKAPETHAREAMEKILRLLSEVEMPDIEGKQMSIEEKEDIRERIDRIRIQLFSNERLSSVVIELLEERTDIPLAFLVDSNDSSLIMQFSRPKPLFKESQVREFLLVHTTLLKTLESFDISEKYSYFLIESDDYVVVACNGGRLLSVASGAMRTPVEDVYQAATSMCYADAFDDEIKQTSEGSPAATALVQENGRINNESGTTIPHKASIFLSSLIKNIDSLFRALTRRPFSQFYAKTSGNVLWSISLTRTPKGIEFELKQI